MTRMYVNIPLILSLDIDFSLEEQEIVEVNNRVAGYREEFIVKFSYILTRACFHVGTLYLSSTQMLEENQGSEQCRILKASQAKAPQKPCHVIHCDR